MVRKHCRGLANQPTHEEGGKKVTFGRDSGSVESGSGNAVGSFLAIRHRNLRPRDRDPESALNPEASRCRLQTGFHPYRVRTLGRRFPVLQ